MTPQDVIDEVRVILQDSRTPYRYSDTVLLGFVNLSVKRLSILRPDLFMVLGDIPTTPNAVLQSLPSGAMRLSEVFSIKGGGALTEASRERLDQSFPGWVSAPAGTPVNFMRHMRNPGKFFLYPPPVEGIELVAEYAQSPAQYTINEEIALLPDAYLPVIVDGTVYLAESVDNEHVNQNRAKLFLDSFTQAISLSLQSRALTDTEEAGFDPKQVI
jgi:hypothetical protein